MRFRLIARFSIIASSGNRLRALVIFLYKQSNHRPDLTRQDKLFCRKTLSNPPTTTRIGGQKPYKGLTFCYLLIALIIFLQCIIGVTIPMMDTVRKRMHVDAKGWCCKPPNWILMTRFSLSGFSHARVVCSIASCRCFRSISRRARGGSGRGSAQPGKVGIMPERHS